MRQNWRFASDYSATHFIKHEEVRITVPLIYYDSEFSKLMALVIATMPNAKSRMKYYENDSANRICLFGSDTVSMGIVVAGFIREREWELFPFEARTFGCYDSDVSMIKDAQLYLEKEIRHQEMNYVAQDGPERGKMKSRTNDYGVLDPGFWTGGWLWMQDTVGSDSLYWFQNGGYVDDALEKCFKCIIPLVPPVVVLPDSLRNR